jgi:hypothetical protein
LYVGLRKDFYLMIDCSRSPRGRGAPAAARSLQVYVYDLTFFGELKQDGTWRFADEDCDIAT